MVKLAQRLTPWESRINALQLRERLLLLLTLVVLTYGVIDALFFSQLRARMEQAEQSLIDGQNKLAVLEQQSRELAASGDPLAHQKQTVRALQQTTASLEHQLEASMGNLLSYREAPQLLRELIDNRSHLQLRKLETRQSTAMAAEPEPAATGTLSRFNLELDLAGSYLDTLDFLTTLEKSDWKLFWDRFSLRVTEHPQAQIQLKLFTLGIGT